MKIRWGKLISWLLVALLCYVVVCGIVVPLRHREESEDYRQRFESRMNEFMSSQGAENVRLLAENDEALMWRLNYRMHDKYLIADDKICILGGRNTNDLFLGSGSNKPNIDKDVLLYRQPGANGGKAIDAVIGYFENNWDKEWSKSLSYRISFNKKEENLKNLRKHYKEMRINYPEAFEKTDWQEKTFHADGVMLVINPVNISNKEPEIWYSLCRVMEEGEEILINTPYIICNNRMYDDLNHLAEGGRKIGFLTNSVENGANPWGCCDYMNQKKKLQKHGAHVFEYLGGKSLHTKTMIIDDDLCVVGSCNTDMRSVYLDTEMMLVIRSEELNKAMKKVAEGEISYSKYVLPDGTETMGDNYEEKKRGAPKKLLYSVIRVAILPFRHLL